METSKKHVNLKKIFSESGRVVKSQKRILIQLLFAFILPLSLATALYSAPKPQISIETTNPKDKISHSKIAIFLKIDIYLALGHYLVALIFSICATSSITFTAFNGFNDEPTKLKATIKSISASFFPLLATTLLFYAILFVVIFLFSIVVMIFLGALALLGFTQLMASKYFIVFFVVSIMAIVMYLEVNWSLASTVVVVESKWGFEALKRSKALIKDKRWLAFTLMLVLAIYNLIFSWNSGVSVTGLIRRSFIKGSTNFNTNSLFIMLVLILVNTCIGAIGQLCNLVATTVLYACCKESHQVDEYFSLLVKEEKVASVV